MIPPPPAQARLAEARLAEAWFRRVLAELAPERLLAARLRRAPALDRYHRIAVFAFGKAAPGMLSAWLAAAPRRRHAPAALECWVAAPAGAPQPGAWPAWATVHAYTGGHPQPNRASLAAARAMLAGARCLAASREPALLVALVSGGGSALTELPRSGGLAGLRRLNRALVASGAPIGEINLIRKHYSAFKGGRLAAAAAGPRVDQVTWVLSDVAGDDRATNLATVASGPTFPDRSTAAAYRRACRRWLPPALQPAPAPRLRRAPRSAVFARSRWHGLANNHDACSRLAALAAAHGYTPVEIDATTDEWEAVRAADYLAARWRALARAHPRPCLIAGGEARVRLPPRHGRGGRNQWLALALAARLEGEPFCFLSAGTDGVDGSSDAAGALVNGATLARARAAGLDPAAHLRRCDPHPLLDACGALVRTGPTGNNLRDLRIFLPASLERGLPPPLL